MTIQEFCTARGIKATVKQVDDNPAMKPANTAPASEKEWYYAASHYRVTLRMYGRSMTVGYSQGYGIRDTPTADRVLECLISDATCGDDFDEFCFNCGYDTDSRKAERIYRACVTIRARLRRFLGSEYDTALSLEY